MGSLHAGHLSLIKRARQDADFVVVSIFVNPLQFGKNEDFSRYPRPFEKDFALCQNESVDAIFHPDARDIFSGSFGSTIEGGPLTKLYCGKSRPGHFAGVLTIVSMLFHIIKPHVAYFGEKDFQQLFLIKRMVRDLCFDIDIVPMPIVREADGLAMSSRNIYLDGPGRRSALALSQAIKAAREAVQTPEITRKEVIHRATAVLEKYPEVRKDYVSLVDERTLLPLGDEVLKTARLLLAAYVCNEPAVRLIDNALLTPTSS